MRKGLSDFFRCCNIIKGLSIGQVTTILTQKSLAAVITFDCIKVSLNHYMIVKSKLKYQNITTVLHSTVNTCYFFVEIRFSCQIRLYKSFLCTVYSCWMKKYSKSQHSSRVQSVFLSLTWRRHGKHVEGRVGLTLTFVSLQFSLSSYSVYL